MVRIRVHDADDLPALKSLVSQMHETLRPFDAYLPPAPEIIDAYFEYLIRTSAESAGRFLVAEEDGQIVGYLCLFGLCPPPEPDQYPDKYAAVADVYVMPIYRDRGIGKALMRRAEEHARDVGAKKVELNVLWRNANAVEFYERLGYAKRIVTLSKEI